MWQARAQWRGRSQTAGAGAALTFSGAQVIELIEQLRAQHVFPTAMLRLHAHEWDTMLSDATGGAAGAPTVPWGADL